MFSKPNFWVEIQLILASFEIIASKTCFVKQVIVNDIIIKVQVVTPFPTDALNQQLGAFSTINAAMML